MTTAAAIDRIVHHSVILELPGPTWRGDEALQRVQEAARSAEAAPAIDEEVARSAAEPTCSADPPAESALVEVDAEDQEAVLLAERG